VETEDGMGVVGWINPEQHLFDFCVVVGSWGDWSWAECWRQLGVRSLSLVAFIDAALGGARSIWGTSVDLDRSMDFLNSYRNDCDVYVCHVPRTKDLEGYFGYLATLGARLWLLTMPVQNHSRREVQRSIEAKSISKNFQVRRLTHDSVGGSTNLEFWVVPEWLVIHDPN
jgi:hypothetical protein